MPDFMNNENDENDRQFKPDNRENLMRVSDSNAERPDFGFMGKEGGMGGPGMGKNSSGADLVYTDDSIDSYSILFDSAKTTISKSDKLRLIQSIKNLSLGDLENSVDIDASLRYFVVHNFVCNYDSYTGNMLHNYYLYEKDGKMTILPWDYNLAFGGFSHGGGRPGEETDGELENSENNSVSNMVNMLIDEPLSGANNEERPFCGKLIENESCKEEYHKLFSEFINNYFMSGYFENKLDYMSNLIRDYVKNDATAFYTVEEFDKGVDTLKKFCLLRSESIWNQLNGKDDIISVGDLNLDDLGTQFGGHDNFNKEKEFGKEAMKP